MELDACTSSDALLMNIFSYPGVTPDGKVSALLGIEAGMPLDFGYKARVPLANGRFDRTEVDLRLGDLLIEAKLTKSDFQERRERALGIPRFPGGVRSGAIASDGWPLPLLPTSPKRARRLCASMFILRRG